MVSFNALSLNRPWIISEVMVLDGVTRILPLTSNRRGEFLFNFHVLLCNYYSIILLQDLNSDADAQANFAVSLAGEKNFPFFT